METRTINEEYAKIAHDLIETEPLLDNIRQSEVEIVYLSSDMEKKTKGRLVCGQCEKIDPKYKWAIPCDFTITVFEPNVITFTDEQIKILLFHELLHVGIEFLGDGTEKYSIRPHDVEEFRSIIDRYGLDWDLPEWSIADGNNEEE
jgi:predicted metallopeptidase